MLEPQDRPLPELQNRIQQELIEVGDAIWAGPALITALTAYFHQLSPESSFETALEPQNGAMDRTRPRMSLAPALLVRKRSDRGLVRVFAEIAEQLSQGGPIPGGVESLVRIGGESPSADTPYAESEICGSPEDELYFPLPANEAQREIAGRLAGRQGVLVQGPPGTGKSYTIANLICHLLATGKRLLVTSHTARALRVLKKYIPREFAPLCVSLLGDDTRALRELEESVQGILTKLNQWDSGKNQTWIALSKSDLDSSRRQLAEGYSRLKTIRAAETETNAYVDGYIGTPQDIAAAVAAEAARFGWIGAGIGPDQRSPLTNGEALSLLALWRDLGNDPAEDPPQALPELGVIPNPARFDQLVRHQRELETRLQTAPPQSGPFLRILTAVPVERRRVLEADLRGYLALLEKLSNEQEGWVKTAIQEVMCGRHHSWKKLAESTASKLQFLRENVDQAAQLNVTGIEHRNRADVRAHTETLHNHLLAGKGTGLSVRFNPLAPKHLKASLFLVDEVRVNGRPCERQQETRALLQYLDVKAAIEYVDEQWAPHSSPSALPMPQHVSEQARHAELLASVLNLRSVANTLVRTATEVPALQVLAFHDREAITAILDLFGFAAVHDQLQRVHSEISRALAELVTARRDRHAHDLSVQILEAAEDRDVDRYAKAHHEVTCAWELRAKQQQRRALETKLGRPELVAGVRSSCHDPVWDTRMAMFVETWNWARADGWLKEHADPRVESSIRQQIDLAQQRIRKDLQDLGASKAWEFVLARLKPEQREHLMAWRLAVKKIGKGTGKYAGEYRKQARHHLEYCRAAIPAWVMPIYRVAETTKAAPNLFDVAIIDEASQSGPEALFLQYIARKVVVVGDDQQISPDSVGLDRTAVDALRQRYIMDLPHWDALGVDNSFFDQAQIRFAGRIRLCEHFRCMPEIIQFSNTLCYQAEPLVPLRQYGTGRLTPIVTRHVRDGYATGSGERVVNQPEAEAIVAQVVKCIADPSYDGKSFGVICLQGTAQANLIRNLLMDRIGVQQMQARALVCGNAYAFQGDERDVIFLSMVAATNEGRRIGVFSKEADKRRFNVAASRARDQMWLFHCVALDDLSALCFRRQLLEYCLNPKVETKTVEGIDVGRLRQQARESGRANSKPPVPFDSWFEVDVFLQIVGRGFRVIPQYELASKRIDLLVEGMEGRLAVECDGDQWHGLEEWDRDVDRQRMLERCGLRFWRVRGSAYYRDPDTALEPLWHVLEEQGVFTGFRATPRPSPGPPALAPEVTEVAVEAEIDDGELRHEPPELDSDSEFFEPGEEQQQAPLFPATSLTAPLSLPPYAQWTPHPVPDVHSAPLPEIINVLVEIVAAEGPVVCRRVYSLYNRAAGNSRLGRQIVHVLNRASYRAVKLGRLAQNDEQRRGGQMNQVVRITGAPELSVRERGPRSLEDIPPLEIAAVRERLRQQEPDLGEDQMVRRLAAVYGIVRKTTQVRKMLLG
jgi:very-short-patch-repair endonuclease/sirohydrochlorin ferrochelatase